MTHVTHASFVLLSAILIACGGRVNGGNPGEDRSRPGPNNENQVPNMGALDGSAAMQPDVSDAADIVRGDAADTNEGDASAAHTEILEELAKGPTVWIGQIEMQITFPWPEYPRETRPPERVVLILDAVKGPVTGTITFGNAKPIDCSKGPEAAALEASDGRVDRLFGTETWPYPGFGYSLDVSELTGIRLGLQFRPVEVWQACPDWSAEAEGVIVDPHCDESACRPGAGVRRLELVVNERQMRGEVTGSSGARPLPIALERVE